MVRGVGVGVFILVRVKVRFTLGIAMISAREWGFERSERKGKNDQKWGVRGLFLLIGPLS